MATDTNLTSMKRRRRVRVALMLLVLLLVAIVSYTFFVDVGAPVLPAHWPAPVSVPKSENGIYAYHAVVRAYGDAAFSQNPVPASEWIQRPSGQELLALFDRALEFEQIALPKTSHGAELFEIVKLLTAIEADLEVALGNGDMDTAARDIERGCRLVRQFENSVDFGFNTNADWVRDCVTTMVLKHAFESDAFPFDRCASSLAKSRPRAASRTRFSSSMYAYGSKSLTSVTETGDLDDLHGWLGHDLLTIAKTAPSWGRIRVNRTSHALLASLRKLENSWERDDVELNLEPKPSRLSTLRGYLTGNVVGELCMWTLRSELGSMVANHRNVCTQYAALELAIGFRRYEAEHGVLPEELDTLREFSDPPLPIPSQSFNYDRSNRTLTFPQRPVKRRWMAEQPWSSTGTLTF